MKQLLLRTDAFDFLEFPGRECKESQRRPPCLQIVRWKGAVLVGDPEWWETGVRVVELEAILFGEMGEVPIAVDLIPQNEVGLPPTISPL